MTVTKEDVFDMLNADPKEVAAEITRAFYENYNYLKENGGHAIDGKLRRQALNQVLYYWKKNRALMERITDSEVKLTLPEQKTPNLSLPFSIEGVVDIVEESDRTILYDLKTHDPERIRADTEPYREQLYVYAYIWKNLMGNRVDDTAIIATPLPKDLTNAIKDMEENGLSQSPVVEKELEKWEPLIPIGYEEEEVAQMIESFGEVVERIETHQFSPPPLKTLEEKKKGFKYPFAVHVCRNCDARFSCESYFEYVKKANGIKKRGEMFEYMLPLKDENEDFIDGNLQEGI